MMKIDWVATIGHAVAVGVVMILLIATFAREAVAPGAMILVAGVSAAVALSLFMMVSFASFGRMARGEVDAPTGDEAHAAITRMNDEQWGGATLLRVVLFAQLLVVAFVFGAESAEFLAAFSGFAISVLLMIRQLKDVGSSQ